MANSRFEAQVLTNIGRSQATQRVELTFVSASGSEILVSLPARVAADMLVPVLTQFSAEHPRPTGAPEFFQNVTCWQAGQSNEDPLVLFRLNTAPYAMSIADAKQFWRAIREATELVECRKPATRQ